MGYIYLMKPVGHNVYKIGTTIDTDKRIIRYQKKFDFELMYYDYIQVDDDICYAVEHGLHVELYRYHVGGEWFVLPDEIVSQFSFIAKSKVKQVVDREEYQEEMLRTGKWITG